MNLTLDEVTKAVNGKLTGPAAGKVWVTDRRGVAICDMYARVSG